jgi:hypothetical protein
MKHLSEYSREEIIQCLLEAGYSIFDGDETETLRNTLNSFIQDGSAPSIEELDDETN